MLLIRKYISLIGQKNLFKELLKVYNDFALCSCWAAAFKKSYKLFFKLVKSQTQLLFWILTKLCTLLWFYSLWAQTCVVWSCGTFVCWCHNFRPTNVWAVRLMVLVRHFTCPCFSFRLSSKICSLGCPFQNMTTELCKKKLSQSWWLKVCNQNCVSSRRLYSSLRRW